MAVNIGDIWPHSSGTSNLGVDTSAGTINGFSEEIRPFAHIHQNSGIFHGSHGSSGIIRYSSLSSLHTLIGDIGRPDSEVLQFSVNGGQDYLLSIGSGSKNNITSNNLEGRVFMEVPGNQDFQLIASGIEFNSNGNCEIVTGNGLTCTVGGNLTNIVNGNCIDQYGGIFTLNSEGLIIITSENGPLTLQALNNDVSFRGNLFEIVANDDVAINATKDIFISSFGSSGTFNYQFGPYEAWHVNAGAGSFTTVPIPHSGHVVQMIAELATGGIVQSLEGSDGGGITNNSSIILSNGGGINIQTISNSEIEFINTGTLQRAYNNGQTIFIDGSQNLQISAGLHKLKLGTNGNRSEISLSGILSPPTKDIEVGDINMFVHAQEPFNGFVNIPTSIAEAQAASLGPGIPVVNTGSGIINFSIGSGISSFFNLTTQTLSTVAVNLNFPIAGNSIPDQFYTIDSNQDIRIMVPGLYKAIYAASVEKTAGTSRQQADVQLELNSKLIFGSVSSAYIRNSVSQNTNTANGICLFDANAGDILSMSLLLTSMPLGNTVKTKNRACNLIIEYIGPRRGLTTVSL